MVQTKLYNITKSLQYYRCPSCKLTFIFNPKNNRCPICDKQILYNLLTEQEPRINFKERKQQTKLTEY